MRSQAASLALVLGMILTPELGFAEKAVGVSPGAEDRFTTVEARCPTFIWGGEKSSEAYEIVVYRINDERVLPDVSVLDLNSCEEVLFKIVPGGATGWQPDMAEAFDRGAEYVWFVRGVFGDGTGERREVGQWSDARFFSVSNVVNQGEFEQALSVVQRYLDQKPATATGPPISEREPLTHRTDRPPTEDGRGSARAPKSVLTATAAIKGSISNPNGESYGVVGLNASPDGAGVAAANSAGGPDLVMDGSEDGVADTLLRESGIDRPSATAQFFSIQNSMGGGVALQVDGDTVLTTASTLDADSLDGVDGTDYATEVEAVAMIATHAASADHDGRYFTETELGASGTAAVHWDNLSNVPPGFADGVDDQESFSVGPGLILENGVIQIDPGFAPPQISIVDTSAYSIGRPAITVGSGGRELIAYTREFGDSELRVASCLNSFCVNPVISILDNDPFTEYSGASIAVRGDGIALISYTVVTDTTSALKVAPCDNYDCSSATTAILDSSGVTEYVGFYSSVTIGTDGLGLISYFSNYNLKVAHCDDISCRTATTAVLDDTAEVGWHTSIAIGGDGLGLISYSDGTNQSLKVAHCDDAVCSTATATTVATTPLIPSSVAIGADGFGLISYCDANGLTVIHCNNAACTSFTTTVIDSTGENGWFTAIDVASNGFGLVSYNGGEAGGSLRLAICEDAECSMASIATVDSGGYAKCPSLVIGYGQRRSISFLEKRGPLEELKITHLGSDVP